MTQTSLAFLSGRSGIHLRLLGMAALWGASWPMGRIVALSVPPLLGASMRFVMASALLLLWWLSVGGGQRVKHIAAAQWGWLVLAAATGIFGYSVSFMIGLQHLPAGRAAMVITLNPAATLLLAALFFREKLNWLIVCGMVFAMVGAAMAISGGAPWQLLSGSVGAGELIVLGCVGCWVAYTLIGRRLQGVDALTMTTLTAVMGAVMLLGASWVFEGASAWHSLQQAAPITWLSIFGMALGATVLGYAWFLDGVKTLGASAAAAYITLVPIFGVLFSSLWLSEHMDASLLVGGALAIAGMGIMHWGRRA